MKILVACEESQAVMKELRKLGHEAYSCDIDPCSGGYPEWHLQQNVIPLLRDKWDMIIAFPPCTYLTNAGSMRLRVNGEIQENRMVKARKARKFFMQFFGAACERIAIENPLPGKIHELPSYTQIVEPYMFGDPWKKRTCLWLRGLPPLLPTEIVEPKGLWVGATVDIKLVDLAAADPVNTWSATKPAYAFTPLCPDVRYRPCGELYGMVIKRRDNLLEMWEENELKKEYLKSYKKAKIRKKRILDEIQRLRADQMFPSVSYDDMPHGPGISDLSDYIVRVEAKVEKLKLERLEKIKLYSEIEGRIKVMADDNEREVLRLRYLTGLSWEAVAVEMGYGWRHTHNIHASKLKNFSIA